jgi:hypothetical protein
MWEQRANPSKLTVRSQEMESGGEIGAIRGLAMRQVWGRSELEEPLTGKVAKAKHHLGERLGEAEAEKLSKRNQSLTTGKQLLQSWLIRKTGWSGEKWLLFLITRKSENRSRTHRF